MKHTLVAAALALAILCLARWQHPARVASTCVNAGPYYLLGYQVVPYVHQCVPVP